MLLTVLLLVLLLADIWLAWVLFSGAGVIAFLTSIPVIAIILIGGGVALGLMNVLISRHYDLTRSKKFIRGFVRGWLWLICLVWFLPWGVFGALMATNTWLPASLPRITLSNGDKTLVFQSMMHIASEGFYDDVREDMQKLVGQEYVFFYEGVRPGTDESLERLGALMGTDVSPEMYDAIGTMAGLVPQNPEEYITILPSTNVDISTDDIVRIAEEQKLTPPTSSSDDLIKKLQASYPTMNPTQKYVTSVVSRAALNLILRIYERPEIAVSLESQVPVFAVILGERNKNIVTTIEGSPAKHIYMHYGALHFPGVLAMLQNDDPRWREISRTSFVVIR